MYRQLMDYDTVLFLVPMQVRSQLSPKKGGSFGSKYTHGRGVFWIVQKDTIWGSNDEIMHENEEIICIPWPWAYCKSTFLSNLRTTYLDVNAYF
jgi:hypothetical protein